MNQKIVAVAQKDRVGCITLSGFITSEKNTAAEISQALDQIEPHCDSIEMTCLNLYGGSVYEGLGIRNRMKKCSVPIKTIADGLCASMGTVIWSAGSTKEMAKASRLLFHRPTSVAEGDADSILESGNALKGLEQELCNCYVEDLGMDEQTVRDLLMVRGKDTVMDCATAMKHKIISKKDVIEGIFKAAAPLNVVMSSDPSAIFNFYDQQLKNQNTEMKNIPQFVAALQIKSGSEVTEETILREVEATVAKVADLTAKLQAAESKLADQQKAAIESLVNGAVEAGKILETEKATYTELATSNFESTKKALEARTPHVSVTSQMQNKQVADDRKDWTYKDYMKKDSAALAKMQKENPTQFKALKDKYLASRG